MGEHLVNSIWSFMDLDSFRDFRFEGKLIVCRALGSW